MLRGKDETELVTRISVINIDVIEEIKLEMTFELK